MQNSPHKPVLLQEVLDCFKDIDDGYIVDATLGYAGHSEELLKANPNIKLIGIDRDNEAISFSSNRLKPYTNRFSIIKKDFANGILECLDHPIKGILADIGVSSLQLDDTNRGFRFDSEALDMRMDVNSSLSASDVVNSYSKSQLEQIFKDYGEVKEYKRLADLIINNRPFTSANSLANIISKNFTSKGIHPATLAFQAIRIEVNDELGQLKSFLENLSKNEEKLSNTTLAIISFHSLEDRIVKQTFKSWTQNCICPSGIMRCICENNHSKGKIITKKPIIPTPNEIKTNPRSRSSKMRIFKFD
ncbi:MAG: rRNA small subunit methyltransferase H [uncultured Campylobacterales bacterium]|uniref:Ribosomal RNA small subunit methyltransferase H n=1 Tax=uncultured Campylobacterales bacterium TaxID=352960 RepID=A0A6S6SYI2_9BACT|nr:MAG: rRNA small subunit methyltransferase H [uncultured Campylobacterales bacterium]